VIFSLKSLQLKEEVEESECPPTRFDPLSQKKMFGQIHQPKVALRLRDKVLLLLQNHS
jgi:hypothetical protein